MAAREKGKVALMSGLKKLGQKAINNLYDKSCRIISAWDKIFKTN